MLPLAGLVVGLGPREPEHVGQEPLGDAMPAHHALGEHDAVVGQPDLGRVVNDQSLALEPADHLGHRGSRDVQAIGDPGLDHVDIVFLELEDAFAVFLECRVVLSSCGHGESLVTGRAPSARLMR